MRIPVIVIPLAGLLHLMAGSIWAGLASSLLAVALSLVAAELALRALATWFLPPPEPAEARAAIGSVAALLFLPEQIAQMGLTAPTRTHFGLDFSRSLALRTIRGAALPTALLVGLAGWGLTGVAVVNSDQRGVPERFGAPTAVWQPGIHFGLPWPFGRVRLVELGVVHTIGLGGDAPADLLAKAEDPAPASAERLWEVAHPGELSYLIAGTDAADTQSFATVSVDLKVLYRVGLDDGSALRATYMVVAPEPLVRAAAGRLIARLFAGQVLAEVIGENRLALSEGLRAQLQGELDRAASGLEVMGIVIEAIHPPPGAADAYHNVQAAEIVANTAIATERGRAQTSGAMARQQAAELNAVATSTAAEAVGKAEIQLRMFTADAGAAAAGGRAFLLERYYANLTAALTRSPALIVDHRLHGADAPILDLRAFGAPTGQPGDP